MGPAHRRPARQDRARRLQRPAAADDEQLVVRPADERARLPACRARLSDDLRHRGRAGADDRLSRRNAAARARDADRRPRHGDAGHRPSVTTPLAACSRATGRSPAATMRSSTATTSTAAAFGRSAPKARTASARRPGPSIATPTTSRSGSSAAPCPTRPARFSTSLGFTGFGYDDRRNTRFELRSAGGTIHSFVQRDFTLSNRLECESGADEPGRLSDLAGERLHARRAGHRQPAISVPTGSPATATTVRGSCSRSGAASARRCSRPTPPIPTAPTASASGSSTPISTAPS